MDQSNISALLVNDCRVGEGRIMLKHCERGDIMMTAAKQTQNQSSMSQRVSLPHLVYRLHNQLQLHLYHLHKKM